MLWYFWLSFASACIPSMQSVHVDWPEAPEMQTQGGHPSEKGRSRKDAADQHTAIRCGGNSHPFVHRYQRSHLVWTSPLRQTERDGERERDAAIGLCPRPFSLWQPSYEMISCQSNLNKSVIPLCCLLITINDVRLAFHIPRTSCISAY
jgi:hypothetical protein